MVRKNKIIIILISIAIIIGAFLIFYNIQNKSSQPPKISISEEEWDFGKVKEDERPVHIFTIKNIGREELIISRVRSACGCVATMLSSDNIQPGKSAELKITFNPTGYEGLTKQNIYIESNSILVESGLEYIKHEIYSIKIFNRFENILCREYGKNLKKLRNIWTK